MTAIKRCPECRHNRHGWRCQQPDCPCQRRKMGGSKNFPAYGTRPASEPHHGVKPAPTDTWPGRP